MGSNDDIMHEFVRKELRKLYPSVDGWQIRPAAKSGGKEQGFIVARRILGRSEGAYVLVSFDRNVTPPTVDSLVAMARKEPIPGLASPKMILVVPQNTDVTGVSREVTVLPMQSFVWVDKELVWLKRRNQMSEKAQAAKSS
ncbi:MAG: hypothetical protein MUE45_04485 [Methanoregulaceae archaeon]|jgi:hypothetical protein|nr:hypothetical protein [Methanoregulaceae archaeon]MCU0628727.1 hypothetical protein [Methanoregulaceae archaeon]